MRVVFMGTPDFAVAPLKALIERHDVALVVTQPDKKSGRGKRLLAPPVKQVAEAAGAPVIQPKSARAPEFAQALRQTGAEIAVVAAYGKIVPKAVLDAFPRGCINVHGSLLPKYRGAAPIQWAVIRGETETGVTIMRMDEGMDTGPMLLKRSMEILPGDTAGSVFARMAPIGAAALIDALARLEAGDLPETPQDSAAATYAPMLKKADGVIDWSASAADVCNRVRGVDPWPGAVTLFGGERLKLAGAAVLEPDGERGRPGEVLAVDRRGLVVACGRGILAIATLQAPGRRPTPAKAFVSGRPIPSHTLLGDPKAS